MYSPTGRLRSEAPVFHELPKKLTVAQRTLMAALQYHPHRLGKSWLVLNYHALEMQCKQIFNRGEITRVRMDDCFEIKVADNWLVRRVCADVVNGHVTLS